MRAALGRRPGTFDLLSWCCCLPCCVQAELERQAALSNRAAALLVLGRYAEGEADCCQALALALAALHSMAAQQQQQQQDPSSSPGSSAAAAQAMEAVPPSSTSATGCLAALKAAAEAASLATTGPLARTPASVDAAEAALGAYVRTLGPLGPVQPCDQACASGAASTAGDVADGASTSSSLGPAVGGSDPCSAGPCSSNNSAQQAAGASVAGSLEGLAPLARLLARRGALRGHMRQYEGACRDCRLASQLFGALQEASKAQQLEEDACRLAGLQQQEAARPPLEPAVEAQQAHDDIE